MRTKRHRYTFYPRHGEQLFDLAEDPDEQRNLAASAAHAGIRRDLRDRLLELIVLQDYPVNPVQFFFPGSRLLAADAPCASR